MESPLLPRSIRFASATPQALPLLKGAVRFAIGDPNGLSSNSWRLWVEGAGDVYLLCRDNYREAKVSLHASGRWRMAFTEQAAKEVPGLVPPQRDRAWSVWEKPPETIPSTVIAFRLFFLPSELAVTPAMRPAKQWRDVLFFEQAPAGCVSVVSLLVSRGKATFTCEAGPTAEVAVLPLAADRFVTLVIHVEIPSPEFVEKVSSTARMLSRAISGRQPPRDSRLLQFGEHANGSRHLIEMRYVVPGATSPTHPG
jgi:hypothetical protein